MITPSESYNRYACISCGRTPEKIFDRLDMYRIQDDDNSYLVFCCKSKVCLNELVQAHFTEIT